jgi:hypothetical protein
MRRLKKSNQKTNREVQSSYKYLQEIDALDLTPEEEIRIGQMSLRIVEIKPIFYKVKGRSRRRRS